jgi:hypothetical protein
MQKQIAYKPRDLLVYYEIAAFRAHSARVNGKAEWHFWSYFPFLGEPISKNSPQLTLSPSLRDYSQAHLG